MATADTDATTSTLDAAALVDDAVLADTWTNGLGKRLYRLLDGIGEQPPVFAFTTYERDIDPETGDTVETETIEAVGQLTPSVNLRSAESRLLDRLQENNDPGHEYWDGAMVDQLLFEFENYIDDRLADIVATVDPYHVVDIHLHQHIRIAIDLEQEARQLAETGSFTETEWETFFWALEEETTCVAQLTDVDHPADDAYVFQPSFEAVPEWRLRAAEYVRCGVFVNKSALANVAALLESDTEYTHAEVAKLLGKARSTITQQVADAEDWLDRCDWMCANQ